jgi:hypothetical protein
MTPQYTCERCKQTFIKGWSDEEMLAEFNQKFNGHSPARDDIVILCDDCYKLAMQEIQRIMN